MRDAIRPGSQGAADLRPDTGAGLATRETFALVAAPRAGYLVAPLLGRLNVITSGTVGVGSGVGVW